MIAFSRGGTGETILGLDSEMPTGVLFDSQDASSIAAAVRAFEVARTRISRDACVANARRFARHEFRERFSGFVETAWREFDHARRHPTGERAIGTGSDGR